MAKGNPSSMNNEMAGKILSEVSGTSDVMEAVANELKATSTVRIALSECVSTRTSILLTRDTSPESSIQRLQRNQTGRHS